MKHFSPWIFLVSVAFFSASAAEILEGFEAYEATNGESWKPPRSSPWRLVSGVWTIAKEGSEGKILTTGAEDGKGELLWLPDLIGDENAFSFRWKFHSEFPAKDGAVAYLRLVRLKDGRKDGNRRNVATLALEKGQFSLISRDPATGAEMRTALGDGYDAERWYAVRIQLDVATRRWRARMEPPGRWSEWAPWLDASLDGVDGFALYQRHMTLAFDDFRAAKTPTEKEDLPPPPP